MDEGKKISLLGNWHYHPNRLLITHGLWTLDSHVTVASGKATSENIMFRRLLLLIYFLFVALISNVTQATFSF